MGGVEEKWGGGSPQIMLYTGSIIAVLAGFANFFFNKGIILRVDTGFYTLTSITLILWGITFFILAAGTPNDAEKSEKRRKLRRIITFIAFIVIATEKLLPLTTKSLFGTILLTTLFWLLYRMFTYIPIDEDEIVIKEAEMKKEETEGKITVPIGIRTITWLHYLLGTVGLAAGIYLGVNPTILQDLQSAVVDLIMGSTLTGLILLLAGFALSKGSKVIRFFDILAWAALTLRIIHLGWQGTFSGYEYFILIPAILILDYFMFSKNSRIYFERMS